MQDGLELGEDVDISLLRLKTQLYAHVGHRKLPKSCCGKEKRPELSSSEASHSNVRKREKKHNPRGHATAAQPGAADRGSNQQQRKGQGAGKEIKDRKYKAPGEVRGTQKAPWHVYYDGASVMDRTHSGSGAVLHDHEGMTVDEVSQYMGAQSMNVADYVGLIEGLRLAYLWKVDNLVCHGDSLVVHKQVRRRSPPSFVVTPIRDGLDYAQVERRSVTFVDQTMSRGEAFGLKKYIKIIHC
jgi:hypothetical protein